MLDRQRERERKRDLGEGWGVVGWGRTGWWVLSTESKTESVHQSAKGVGRN